MAIKDFFLDAGAGILGKITYSYKTKVVGIGLILFALVNLVARIYNDPSLPTPVGWDEIYGYFMAGFAALGIGHKIEKAREENRVLTAKVIESNENTAVRVEAATAPCPEPPIDASDSQSYVPPERKDPHINGQFP